MALAVQLMVQISLTNSARVFFQSHMTGWVAFLAAACRTTLWTRAAPQSQRRR